MKRTLWSFTRCDRISEEWKKYRMESHSGLEKGIRPQGGTRMGMSPEDAQTFLHEIEQAIGTDTVLLDLYRQMLVSAIRYARLRTEWFMAPVETRCEIDAQRRAAHNAFIDACNILSRAMNRLGKPIKWRRALGEDRKEIGDFACWLHGILGNRAR